ncbi:GntR family transcriptional regulator [Paenibacillus eucommiae]|uniref:DNA-binding GntR family transcriptional regulator n=1 Tax=Paenibacillus eucommiae TaxID=1355755 RepID=A0ABS4IYD1_9BACL|nr:GntR family transcriptional regulator [Paenibacillus eucommiae]MBP1992080.1 DNA-binding GntR family transcriptional regulator [Paenibacillus eucommiae]
MKEETGRPALFQKQNISEDLIVYLKQQILSGELNPGDRVVETKLAKELGISQTPVREALRQLQGEGIITIIPNKGPMVCSLDITDAFEVYSIRSMLEGLAIRLATQNASEEDLTDLERVYNGMKDKVADDTVPVSYLLNDSFYIHETIMKLSNHSRLISMYKSISFQIALINRIMGSRSSKMKEMEEHWELVEVLKQRDPDRAEDVMRRHIYRSYSDFVKWNAKDEGVAEYGENVWLNKHKR